MRHLKYSQSLQAIKKVGWQLVKPSPPPVFGGGYEDWITMQPRRTPVVLWSVVNGTDRAKRKAANLLELLHWTVEEEHKQPKGRGGAGAWAVAKKNKKPQVLVSNCVRTRAAIAKETAAVKEKGKGKVEESELRGWIGKGGVGSDTNSREKVDSYKKVMAAEDSGGLSANKAVEQEEEGNTAPFPNKVIYACHFHSSVCLVVAWYHGSFAIFAILT
ncbi:hypothetical protein IFM89_026131 [Coptis chinensis]|uniref:Uncharacterized protein n=1 Tax=Coptis chinensis TaxID=261450 RepID=A0A835M9K4_9MAGN|nr:hypothetical protein IFM89_026131 [Coptis chinensis]